MVATRRASRRLVGDERLSGWEREAPVTDAEIDEKLAMLQQTIEWLHGHICLKHKHSARIKVLLEERE